MENFWSGLHHIVLGQIAECYAKIQFLQRNFEVYSTEADNVGVDFVAIDKKKNVFKIQVKACRNDNYQFVKEKNFYKEENYYVFYIRFVDGEDPDMYLIPTTAWAEKNNAFVYRPYNDGQKSEAEYGINYSKNNKNLFERYSVNNIFKDLLCD